MSARVSRRRLAAYVVDRLSEGDKSALGMLAAYIVDERLVRDVDLIISEIESEFAARRGAVVADVTSARALDEASRASLVQFVAEATGATSVGLREETDTALIGGVIIETPGKFYDGSLVKQLNQLKLNS